MKYRIKRFSSDDTKKKKKRKDDYQGTAAWGGLGGAIGARIGVGKWIADDQKLHQKYLDKISKATKDQDRILGRVNEMMDTVNARGFKTRGDAEAYTKMMENELIPRLEKRTNATVKGIEKMGKVYKKQSRKNGIKNIGLGAAIGIGVGAGVGYGLDRIKKKKREERRKNKKNASKED